MSDAGNGLLLAAVDEAIAAALHVVGSGGILVAIGFVLARAACVILVLAEAMGPAVEVLASGGARWSGAGDGIGRCGLGDHDGAVGAMVAGGLRGEFASSFLGGFFEVFLEVGHGAIDDVLVAPFLGFGYEDAGGVKHLKSKAERGGIGDFFVGSQRKTLDFSNALPKIFNGIIGIPGSA